MSVDYIKAPFPWFGGKADAAETVWSALGDVAHYVEPFAGSLAVLLRRPHLANRPYHSETVNDLDGLLVNAWRSIQHSHDETAEAASWPVSEVDLMARHLALVRWREEAIDRMRADPDYHDPRMAGWWLWGQSSWIGSGWCSGRGPWTIGPHGGLVKQAKRGAREPGVNSKLPHLGDDGKGVNHAGTREPGVGEYHPMTMPELRRWMGYLSARLRHVRILQGSWTRAVTGGASKTIPVRQGGEACGIFLDPPYGDVRTGDLYARDDLSVAAEVQRWCLEHGDDRDYRIVLAGFDTEHEILEAHGWRAVEWFAAGFLRGGMANTGALDDGEERHAQQKRERLWLSPHCLGGADDRQVGLFGGAR